METTPETEAPTTTTFEPTTTTMNYCADEDGMNQPLDIQPGQVSYSQEPEETSPAGDINPTSSTPGIDFPSPYPKISITFNEPTTTTLIYIPTDRPNEPSNVQLFVVTFKYPDGTESETFTSQIPSETTGTTTPSTVVNGIVSPSSTSPQIDLPSNFEIPSGTVLVLRIIATTDANAPKNVTVGIVACVETTTTTVEVTSASTTVVPLTTTTAETSPETSPVTEVTTTSTAQPTTTTIPVCNEETGMDQPVDIQPEQVSYSEQPEETSPPGDINPTTTTPGLNFPSENPEINVTLDNPATVTVVYVPTDRPNEPSNVDEFTVVFVYPNGTTSETFTSTPPSPSESSETTTTPSPSDTVPPSDESPKVILPPNFEVPEGTTVVITITSTDDDQPPTGVTVGIIACIEPSSTTTPTTSTGETTTEAAPVTPGETTPSTTLPPTTTSVETSPETEAPTTTTFVPTTTTMNYCADENGMNQPLDIQPGQVSYNQQPEETSPAGEINPTSSTPGIDFPSPYPQISITFDEPTTTTLIYIPTDRPNEPSNVQLFIVTFKYPDGTQSETFTSQIPSESTGIITPSTISNGIVSPSSTSPQVDLPSNFEIPSGTVVVLTIIATTDADAPKNVTVGIVACVEATTTTTEITSASTTVVPLTTTSAETSPFTSEATTTPPTTGTTTITTVTPVSVTSVECVYSDWTDWTTCSVTCGDGSQTRARNSIAGFCTGPLVDTRVCQMEPCPCIMTEDVYTSTFQKEPSVDSKS